MIYDSFYCIMWEIIQYLILLVSTVVLEDVSLRLFACSPLKVGFVSSVT